MNYRIFCKTCKKDICVLELQPSEIIDNSKDPKMIAHLGHTIEYDEVCKWCNSINLSFLYTEHSKIRTPVKSHLSSGSSYQDVRFCHDCGKITPGGENYYKPRSRIKGG